MRLTGGFVNDAGGTPVNAGLLAALGANSELVLNQAITNAGTIGLNNATAVFTAPSVNNGGTITGNGTFNAALNNAGTVMSSNSGQTLTFASSVNNLAAGTMTAQNGGSFWFSNAVGNAGSILVQGGGTATFAAAVTNSGSISVRDQSTLTFNAGLTNLGTLAIGSPVSPSTAVITGTLLLGQNGVISLGNSTNNTLVVQGDFLNRSTNNQAFNAANGTVTVGGSTPLTGPGVATNTFEVAGNNMGAVFAGFTTNMAIGTLNVTNHMSFVGNGSVANPAQYVDVLHLYSGATMKLSQLTIYVANQFIYEDGNGTKVFAGAPGDSINAGNQNLLGVVNVFFENGGQIVFIPEPSTAVLLGLGLAAMAGSRRRKKSAQS
jgi:hypothetical protein